MSERHRQQEPAIQAESGRLLRSGKNIDSSPKGDFLLKKKSYFSRDLEGLYQVSCSP